jgi:hypothetical protein
VLYPAIAEIKPFAPAYNPTVEAMRDLCRDNRCSMLYLFFMLVKRHDYFQDQRSLV